MKALEMKSKANKPLFNGSSFLKRTCDRNIVNIASLTPNGGAFL
ncbi:anthranilate synthase component I [Helicobacter pylori]|nr:anthranilate synthase component I [Helicobacter pylori]